MGPKSNPILENNNLKPEKVTHNPIKVTRYSKNNNPKVENDNTKLEKVTLNLKTITRD